MWLAAGKIRISKKLSFQCLHLVSVHTLYNPYSPKLPFFKNYLVCNIMYVVNYLHMIYFTICLILLRICSRTVSKTTAKLASYRHYYSESYSTKCGWKGWRRCRRTRYGYINVRSSLIKSVTQLLNVVKTSSLEVLYMV